MIITPRLDLIEASVPTVRAALDDTKQLGVLLGARIPKSWPPELLDPPALEWILRRLAKPDNDPAWGMYWIVLREPRTLVGTAGFKGAPADGTVELGYGVVAEHQRRGYASESVRGMLKHAFVVQGITRVIAETLPGLVASIGVLEKCGFRFIGDGSEPGVIRYEVASDEDRG